MAALAQMPKESSESHPECPFIYFLVFLGEGETMLGLCGTITGFLSTSNGSDHPFTLMHPGPSNRTLSINEEELEGSFRKWNTANKGPEELLTPEVLCLFP